MACLPFFFLLLSLCLLFFYALCLLCFGCPLVLSLLSLCPCGSLCVGGVAFSLSDVQTKRKGANACVLSCPAVGCFIWLRLCIPRTRQVSARLYRNKVLEKGNLIECSKLFCARLCSYLCSSKFVLFLFAYLFLLFGSYFLFPFGCPLFTPFPFQVSAKTPDHNVCSCFAFLRLVSFAPFLSLKKRPRIRYSYLVRFLPCA